MFKNDGQGAFNATFKNISDLRIMDVSLRKLKYTEKTLTSLKTLTNLITYSCIQYTSPQTVINQTHNFRGDMY